MRKKPDEHTGNVFFVEKEKPPREPNHVDIAFASYGGVPESVDNWQAIALTAIDIFSRLGYKFVNPHPDDLGLDKSPNKRTVHGAKNPI